MGKNHICKKCGGIAGWDSYFQSWVCTRCGNEEPKSITNADRIRGMTDDELAEKLASHVRCDMCPRWPMKCEEKCTKYWLDWLKQEVKEGET